MTSLIVILAVLVFGFIALVGFLLYAFNDLDRWNKKRTFGLMLHVNISLAALEKRIALGQCRSSAELDAAIAECVARLEREVGTL